MPGLLLHSHFITVYSLHLIALTAGIIHSYLAPTRGMSVPVSDWGPALHRPARPPGLIGTLL